MKSDKSLFEVRFKHSAGWCLGVLALAILILYTGCSRKVADVDLPYDSVYQFSLPGTVETPRKWWQVFDDPALDSLVRTALDSNFTLLSVWYQLQEARALVKISSSAFSPDVDLLVRSGISRPQPDFVGGENTQFALGADYEVDLWGRIRHTLQADRYRFEASYQDYKTAAISLSAEIALTWFRIKATQNLLQLIDEQIENNENVRALIRARFASGQTRGVDILRQDQLIESTRAQKISLEVQAEILENQLAILLGEAPDLEFDNVDTSLPALPPLPETGIPLQLVNRRPDIQGAFYRLHAADREMAAAISNKYPRLSFSLTAAIRSNTYSDLFQSQAVSLTGSLLTPVFYGGRLSAIVDQTEAVRNQALNDYGQTVIVAFQEVENALVQETKQLESLAIIERQVTLAERTNGQLRIEYLNGSIPYLDVLVSLNQEQQLRRDLINATLTLLEIRIALYRALAGGFETPRETNEGEDG